MTYGPSLKQRVPLVRQRLSKWDLKIGCLTELKGTPQVADFFWEIMWGLSPKASIVWGLEEVNEREAELTRRSGTLHFGIGILGRGFHWDGILIKPFNGPSFTVGICGGHVTIADALEGRDRLANIDFTADEKTLRCLDQKEASCPVARLI